MSGSNFTSSNPAEVAEFCRRTAPITDLRDAQIDDLRNELAETRQLAGRGWAMVKLLEQRLAAVMDAARGT